MIPYEDKGGSFRRKFPRRAMKRKAGLLSRGAYFLVDTGEIGEGGMSIISEYILTEGREVVLSFQVPGGDFVSIRGIVRSTTKLSGNQEVLHGLSFSDVPFGIRRQIRAFVSARTESEAA